MPKNSHPGEAERKLSQTKRNLALFALALGGFAIGVTEFATMGVLPEIARDLLVGYDENPGPVIAQAGNVITVYAVGVVVGAPLFAMLGARMSLTKLACWLLAFLTVATLASALMPNFASVAVFRFISGLPHGAYLGVAALIAARILGPGSMGKGVAISLTGLTIANVVGVPLSTVLGQQVGWRWVYVLVAFIFAVTLVLIVWLVPRYPGNPERSARGELVALRNPRVWIMMGALSVGFGGFFAVYSYIADVTTREVGLSPSMVPWVIAVLGLGMVVGNIVGGVLTDRNPSGMAVWGLVLSVVSFVLYFLFVTSPVTLFVFVFLMSATTSLVLPSLQSRLIRVANEAELLGAALNHGATNIANSLGAWLGGLVIAGGLGYLAPGWLGAVMAAGGLGLMLVSLAVERRDKRRRLDTGGIELL